MATQQTAITKYVDAANGVRFAYRRFGMHTGIPLVLHIHFRANMDFWDPLFINTLALKREIIMFDQAGVGRSSGSVPLTYQGWANDLLAFATAIELDKFDLLGFSMGGKTVLMVALTAPHRINKLIVAGSCASAPPEGITPQGVVWPRDQPTGEAFQKLWRAESVNEGKEAIYFSFFYQTAEARRVFEGYWKRIQERHAEPLMLQLLDRNGGAKNQAKTSLDDSKPEASPNPQKSFHRLGELKMPVLVANGDNDVLIPTSRSWELLTQIENCQLIIYPRAGHGFIWQFAETFAEDVNRFLDRTVLESKL